MDASETQWRFPQHAPLLKNGADQSVQSCWQPPFRRSGTTNFSTTEKSLRGSTKVHHDKVRKKDAFGLYNPWLAFRADQAISVEQGSPSRITWLYLLADVFQWDRKKRSNKKNVNMREGVDYKISMTCIYRMLWIFIQSLRRKWVGLRPRQNHPHIILCLSVSLRNVVVDL